MLNMGECRSPERSPGEVAGGGGTWRWLGAGLVPLPGASRASWNCGGERGQQDLVGLLLRGTSSSSPAAGPAGQSSAAMLLCLGIKELHIRNNRAAVVPPGQPGLENRCLSPGRLGPRGFTFPSHHRNSPGDPYSRPGADPIPPSGTHPWGQGRRGAIPSRDCWRESNF